MFAYDVCSDILHVPCKRVTQRMLYLIFKCTGRVCARKRVQQPYMGLGIDELGHIHGMDLITSNVDHHKNKFVELRSRQTNASSAKKKLHLTSQMVLCTMTSIMWWSIQKYKQCKSFYLTYTYYGAFPSRSGHAFQLWIDFLPLPPCNTKRFNL